LRCACPNAKTARPQALEGTCGLGDSADAYLFSIILLAVPVKPTSWPTQVTIWTTYFCTMVSPLKQAA